MKKLVSYLLPIVSVIAFVLGINIILTCNTGLYSSYANAAIVAGAIVSCFSGILLAIYLHSRLNSARR